MANNYSILKPDNFYHIYNKGINSIDIFTEKTNYEHFISLMEKYANRVADIYAWVLMKNHFHFLIKTYPEDLILKRKADKEPYQVISKEFSNLFNAYSKAFNKKYNRTGPLLNGKFKRKPIENKTYLKNVINYIHFNPVYHGFCKHPSEYPWSSFLSIVSVSYPENNKVLGLFNSKSEFISSTNNFDDFEDINKYLFDKT